jgi:hypothetical protein
VSFIQCVARTGELDGANSILLKNVSRVLVLHTDLRGAVQENLPLSLMRLPCSAFILYVIR